MSGEREASEAAIHAGALFAADFAGRMFADRKGHGQAPVSYLQITRGELVNLLSVAFEMGAKFARESALAAAGRPEGEQA
jgi:hypothetical protein